MLVLTRKVGESIFINGQEIKVTVVGVNKGQVKLGFEAPKEIDIMREELLNK